MMKLTKEEILDWFALVIIIGAALALTMLILKLLFTYTAPMAFAIYVAAFIWAVHRGLTRV